MSNEGRIVVLMYHGFDSDEKPSESDKKGDLLYVVNVDDFKRQMSYLATHGMQVVTLSDCIGLESKSGPEKEIPSVILTFDDGHITNYDIAFPVLRTFGFSGYFFITTDWINKPYYMSEDMIRELHEGGMIIGSHGKTHNFLSDLTNAEIDSELKESKMRLEEIVGSEVSSLSVPGGRIDSRVMYQAKKMGYSQIFDSKLDVIGDFNIDKSLGRCAIKRDHDFSSYEKIVSGSPPVSELIQYKLLKAVKGLIGNKRYQKIRSFLKDYRN